MPKSELIDSHVSEHQCKKAVEALHAHESKKEKTREENELLPGKEQNIWLIVTVKKIQPSHTFKPIKIPIVHPLVDPRTTPVCLITKDPQRQYKDLLESHGIKFISRVVGLAKLKGKFKPFEARRMLLKENGMFLADERIIPLLPKLLGAKWFEAKKQPIPVCLTRKDLKGELERAISSTYMHQNKGTCTSIKISTLSQKPSKILANLKTALPAIAKHIKGGWDNIQSLCIKTNSSASLPIWCCSLDEEEGGRWSGLGVVPDEEMGSSDDEDDDFEADVEEVEVKKATTGKKRASKEQDEDEDDETEKPKKKAKSAEGKAISEQPKEKRKSRVKDSPPPPTPAKSKNLASADIDGVSKSKKRKALLDPATTTSSSPAPVSPKKSSAPSNQADSTDPPPSKKTKHGKPTSAKSTVPVNSTTPIHKAPKVDAHPPADASFSMKKKTSRVSEALEPVPASKATDDAKPKKGKKDKPAAPATPSPAKVSSPPAPVVTEEQRDEEKKRKRKDKNVDGVITSGDGSLSKAEMKLKRSGEVGEKKKDKVVKAKGGKSAKDKVIGKKVAQG